MSDENGAPAPDLPPAASPPPADAPSPASSPDHETDSGQDGEHQAPEKKFTQAEFDKAMSDRIARAESKAERRVLRILEQQRNQHQPQPQAQNHSQQDDGKPNRGHYANEHDYTEALVDWRIGERDRQTQAEKATEQRREIATKTEKFYAEAGKIPGFDREDFDALPLSTPMVNAMLDSDVGPELMALMAQAPEEVARIAKLPPYRQAAEIGRLEVKAAALKTSTAPRASRAPAPFEPIGGRGGTHAGNPETMSQGDYMAMRAKQGASWVRRR